MNSSDESVFGTTQGFTRATPRVADVKQALGFAAV
jgi:hypothetical protein